MTQVTRQQRASHVVESLLLATSEERVLWKVIKTDGARYGLYQTNFRDYEFQAEYRTGQKAFNEVSIKVAGEWLPLGIDTEPVLKLLPILQANELGMLALELLPQFVPNSVIRNDIKH
jgi:hypothetical protein